MKETWKHKTSGEYIEIEFNRAKPDRFYARNTADGPEGDWVSVVLEHAAASVADAIEAAIMEDPENGWMENLWPVSTVI